MKQLTVTGSKVLKPGISQIGLSTIRMPSNREAGIRAIHTALDAGITYLNTGDFYDAGASEMLVGEALKGQNRDQAFRIREIWRAFQVVEATRPTALAEAGELLRQAQ